MFALRLKVKVLFNQIVITAKGKMFLRFIVTFLLTKQKVLYEIMSDNLRYNIQARLESGGRRHYLAVKNKVSRAGLFSSIDTWYKWLKLKDSSSGDIPGKALRFIAKELGCTIEDLFNDPQNKIQNERNAFGIQDQSSVTANQVD